MRETDRFKAMAADGRTFTIIELRQVLTSVVNGRKQELLGALEWQLDGYPSKEVSSVTGDEDEFMILPDNLQIRRIR